MTDSSGLVVRDLVVAYGGHVALDSLNLTAPRDRITGLIGPNGAGKTTAFNACNGLVRPRSGSVTLFGDDVTDIGPARRARKGLGRTFQRMELIDTMDVRTNVALGVESRLAGSRALTQIVTTRTQRDRIEAATTDAIELCGIAKFATEIAGNLSTGQRRLVELARVLAGGFTLLLLDEPSSGLDEEETARFGEILRTAVDEGSLGILLVEHDMGLVMTVCSYIYVLDFGRLIFEGTAPETQTSPIVQAAYLGSDAVVVP